MNTAAYAKTAAFSAAVYATRNEERKKLKRWVGIYFINRPINSGLEEVLFTGFVSSFV